MPRKITLLYSTLLSNNNEILLNLLFIDHNWKKMSLSYANKKKR